MQASLIREAITELLTVNPSTAARLAKAVVPKPSRSAKLHKYATCYASHDEHCYCSDCAVTRSG